MTVDTKYKISMFGPFQVTRGEEEPVEFVADSARALLAYLAAEPEIPHSRESLASMLWPDNNRTSGFNNLRQALKRVKDALGDEEAKIPLVISEKKTIQLNPEAAYWVDVHSFEQAILHAQNARVEESIAYFENALYLYQGEFLHDLHIKSYPFEEWLSANQTKYKEQVLLALSKISAFYFQRNELDMVVQYSRRMLELEPWYEEAQRQLMIAMAMNNQRNRALAEYKRYHQALKQYLDIEPEIETIDIYHRIRSGEIGRTRATARTPRINFPSSTTSFIGRHDELRHIQQEILNPEHRLITLVGGGGAGKTRLSLTAADLAGNDFSNGVVFVPMEIIPQRDKAQEEIIKDENFFFTSLTEALKLNLFEDRTPKDQVLEYLKTANMLLVFDNFEDVIELAPHIVEILQYAPEVTALVTSRESLNLQAEVILRVEGFDVPTDVNVPRLESYNSIQLFTERANRYPIEFDIHEDMQSMIDICRLVDGMPLGIELAAHLVEQMRPAEILKSIQQDIDVLSSTMQDIPERHRSIRAVFESSWRFLSKDEQITFARLSVFNGGFELRAGVQVTNGDAEMIRSLRDKSLLIEVGAERFAMHRVLQQLAAEKLNRAKTTYRLHSKYYLELLVKKQDDFGGKETRQTINRLYPDIANIRSAWLWASANQNFDELDKSLNSLFALYSLRSLYHEGQQLCEDALQKLRSKHAKSKVPKYLECRLVVYLAWFFLGQDQLEQALQTAQMAIDTEGADAKGREMIHAHLVVGKANLNLGHWQKAQAASEKALTLAKAQKFTDMEFEALLQFGLIYFEQIQYELAQEKYQDALALLELIENFPKEVDLLNAMGESAFQLGQYDQALAFYEKGLEVNEEAGNHRMDGVLWSNLANVMVRLGDFQTGLVYYAKAQQNSLNLADRSGQGRALQALAEVSLLLGNPQAAMAHAEQGLKLSQIYDLGPVEGLILHRMGEVKSAMAEFKEAADYYQKAYEHNRFFGRTQLTIDNLEGMARLALALGERKAAQENVEKIVANIEKHTLSGTGNPMRIYLTCYQILKEKDAERACELVNEAAQILRDQSGQIQKSELRSLFLEGVPIHLEIFQAQTDCAAQ